VLYIVENIFSRGIRYYPPTLKIDLIWERYKRSKFWDSKNFNFGTPIWESQGKVTFGFSSHKEAQSILLGKGVVPFPKVYESCKTCA